MSLHNIVEEQIKNAIEAGEFDNLEGAGKPLDMDNYFNTPEDLRVGYLVLKSSRFVPEEVERLKEIGEIKEKIENCADGIERGKLVKTLQERQLAFALLLERNKKSRRR